MKDHQSPPRERWCEIADAIHQGLAEARSEFFEACVKTLESSNGTSVRNRVMNPRIELAMMAYQIHLIWEFIVFHQYFRKEVCDDFVRMLGADALRYGSVEEYSACLRRYLPRNEEEKTGNEIWSFCSDIAQYITGKQEVMIPALTLARATIAPFTITARIPIAAAFGDQKSLEALEEGFALGANPQQS